MRPFAEAFTSRKVFLRAVGPDTVQLASSLIQFRPTHCHSFTAPYSTFIAPGSPQRLLRRLISTETSCIKPGSSPEDVVKRVTKGDVEVSFARSGGAGGQNVNKVNTKVDMRLNINEAEWLSEEMQDSLQRLEKKRINKQGEFVITSQKTRSQADNVEDALEKLQASLDRAAESIIPAKPDPEKAKEIAKRKRMANEKRVQNKKFTAEKKASRGKVDF